MFDNKKGLRAFVALTVMVVALIVNGIFTLGTSASNPSSAWLIEPLENKSGERTADYLILDVDNTDAEGNELTTDENGVTAVRIWINVGRIYNTVNSDYAEITVQHKSTYTFENTTLNQSKIRIKKGIKGEDASDTQYQYNWYCTELNVFNRYWKVFSKDTIEINEIVFTNTKNEVLDVKLYGANEWKQISGNYGEGSLVKAENLSKDSSAFNICDEQHRFMTDSNLSKKYNFTTEEASVINGILGFENGNYADGSNGVLGLELVWAGVAIFGLNTLGVRIIPYVFFIATIILVYFFAKKLFDDSDMGIITSVVYLLFGIGFAVAGIGSLNTIAVFFTLLALYFAHSFYTAVNKYVFSKNKHSFKVSRTLVLVPALLSALFFALALNVKLTSLFALPAIIAIFAFGCVRAKKVYAYNASLAEFEDEKLLNERQYRTNTYGASAMFVFAFVIFAFITSLLFFMIVQDNLAIYYNVNGIFEVMSSYYKGALFGKEAGGEFVKWIAGAGCIPVLTTAEGSVMLAMNVAVQYVSLLSFVCLIGYVIVNLVKGKNSTVDKKSFRSIFVPFVILAVGYIFSWFMYAFVDGANISDYVMASVFASGFIPLAYRYVKLNDKTLFKVKNIEVSASITVLAVILFVALVFFGIGYVCFAGINVSETAMKILYGWWMI